MLDDGRYETHLQLMQENLIQILSRAIERTTRFPLNGYRRRLYFEGLARLGDDIHLPASAAALLVRTAGEDIQGG